MRSGRSRSRRPEWPADWQSSQDGPGARNSFLPRRSPVHLARTAAGWCAPVPTWRRLCSAAGPAVHTGARRRGRTTRGSGSGQAAGPPGGRKPQRAGLVRARAAGPSAVSGAGAARMPQPAATGPPCPRLGDHPYPPAIPQVTLRTQRLTQGPEHNWSRRALIPGISRPRQGLATAHRADRGSQATPAPVARTARLPGIDWPGRPGCAGTRCSSSLNRPAVNHVRDRIQGILRAARHPACAASDAGSRLPPPTLCLVAQILHGRGTSAQDES